MVVKRKRYWAQFLTVYDLKKNGLGLIQTSVGSHKYVTKFMWDILVQLSSLQVSGHWLLATGSWWSLPACLWVGQKPKIKPYFVNYLRDTTLDKRAPLFNRRMPFLRGNES